MLTINLDKLNTLTTFGISSNNLEILVFLILIQDNDQEELDKFLRYSNISTMLSELENYGLIKVIGPPFIMYNDYVSINISSIALRDAALTIVDKTSIDIEILASELRGIYPKKIRSGGVLIRSDLRSTMIKLKKFLQLYPNYTKEEIIKATQGYINERRLHGFQYTKSLEYFILKNNISQLASEIENLSDEEEIEWDKNVV